MLRHTFRFAALTALAGTLACTDRTPPSAPTDQTAPSSAAGNLGAAAAAARAEPLARALALALGDPGFRGYLKSQLDASPFREHKLHFQRFLAADRGRAAAALARGTGGGAAPGDILTQADGAIPLEMYLPVPAHRRAWAGGADVLVATAIRDHDVPVAFDVHGNRSLLDPERPPATPVIALVPVETDFTAAPSPLLICWDFCGGEGGGGGSGTAPPPPPGLYMTQAHFVDDFEGWLKGSPEFEVHILGQKDQTDSLQDYQCAGEKQASPYYFDQNNLDWSGSVLLFSKTQLDNYHATHPGENIRVFVVEDDDTACQIKTTNDFWTNVMNAVDGANQALTAGKDTTSSTTNKVWKFAKALEKLLKALASLINTNDELVGNAVQDAIVGEYHAGYNWIVKGDKDATNGWIKLEMK